MHATADLESGQEDIEHDHLYRHISGLLLRQVMRPTYLKLPAESLGRNPNVCAKLSMSMYDTPDAAVNLHVGYTKTLRQAGYACGVATTCLFYNTKSGVSVIVHGDDIPSHGRRQISLSV